MERRVPCIFCPNPRTKKRGEHVWDDWLNREQGKPIRDSGTTSHTGLDGALIRSYPSVGLEVTVPVVCDNCNNHWMSDISNLAKDILEPIIRRDRPSDLDQLDILTIASFAFLKSAVLDWSVTNAPHRRPCISRASCIAFHHSLTRGDPSDILFPDGLQIWIAKYRRSRKMEAQAFTEEMTGVRHFKGYRILVITYVVGSFIFQLTCPRWSKTARNRPAPPFFQVFGDRWAVPIWPGVSRAYWPPLDHVSSNRLETFRQRLRRITITPPKFP